jgi:hypothetical protein
MYLWRAVAAHRKVDPQLVELQEALLGQQGPVGRYGKPDLLGMLAGKLPRIANHLFDPFVGQEQRFPAVHIEPQGRKAGVLYK